MTSGALPLSGELCDDLAAIYASGASGDAVAAWIRRLHDGFYGRELARVPNKFQHLEKQMTDVFVRVCAVDADWRVFWRFVTALLVQLASNDCVANSPLPAHESKKKSKKKAQPTSPLAFLVVNALKALMKGDEAGEHRQLCLRQGGESADLRALCVRGLGSDSCVDQKLLVELLELFHITDVDALLIGKAVDALLRSKSHSAVIKLCAIHGQAHSRLPEIARAMAQAKDWVSAEQLVRAFDDSDTKELARILIETAIDVRDFKRAHRLVSNFSLQQEYPSIDVLYSRDGLTRLIENKRWQLAITFVGSDPTLQKILLTHMLAVGELSFATQLLERVPAGADKEELMKLVSESSEYPTAASTSTRVGQDADLTRHEYLELPLNDDAVVFCDSECGVHKAIAHFFPAEKTRDHGGGKGGATASAPHRQIVGLDVEWKPVSSRCAPASSPFASILQIASSSAVFIVDLLKLHNSDVLFESFLRRLFTSHKHLKVGFNFESDLKVLHSTFPERAAFVQISSFLDLKGIGDTPNGLAGGNSLSATATRFLGKPLNKKMQLSDWEQRPLSSQQLAYAALDAYCLVQIVDAVVNTNGTSSLDRIGNTASLSVSTHLDAEDVAQCVSRRKEYQSAWEVRVAKCRAAEFLVTPHEIQEVWRQQMDKHESAIGCHQERDPGFAELSLVRYETLKMLRAPRGEMFSPVNSICLFAAAAASAAAEATKPADGKIPVYADCSLRDAKYLAAGSGSADLVIWMKSAAFFSIIDLESVADFAVADPTDDQVMCTGQSEANESARVDNGLCSILESTQSALEYKFLADSMVAQVARWLRTTGVDVAIWDDASSSGLLDPKREMLAMAAREDRIVLTRDTQLPSRRDAGACFVLSDDECLKQFREVKAQFGLLWKREERASRCARCNSTSFAVVDIDFVRTLTSKNVQKALESVTKFWKCEDCSKIYWEGPKYTPTSASTGAADDISSANGVKYRPVARRRVHLVLRKNRNAGA